MYSDLISFIKERFGNDVGVIPLHEPLFIGNEKEYLIDCIDSTFVSSVGAYVDKIEDEFCNYTGSKFAVAVVNGTAALHLALYLSGVRSDEYVLTQPLSFIATCNAISYLGASPIFIDVDLDTMGLSPNSLKKFFENEVAYKNGVCIHKGSGKKISACVPMHTFGHPARIDEIIRICDSYGVPVVEDAAESIGSKYKSKHTGTFGLLGVFSFNGNKTITSGGGGMIVTNDIKLAKQAKHISTTAKIPHQWEYRHDQIGYNYRMPNINAALALAQLEMLEKYINAKRDLANDYEAFFRKKELHFVSEPNNSRSNYWLNTVLAKDISSRDSLLKKLNNNGIQARPAWTLMHELGIFKNQICENTENAKSLSNRIVNLPSSVKKSKT